MTGPIDITFLTGAMSWKIWSLAVKSLGLTCQISYDFEDNGLNHLLGLDDSREVALAMVMDSGSMSLSVKQR